MVVSAIELGRNRRRPEQLPQRLLELLGPPQRHPDRGLIRRREAKVARRRQPGQPATGLCHAGTAQSRAIADREHAGQGGAAVLISLGGQMAKAEIDEAVGNAQCAGQADLRLEAEVQRHHVGRQGPAVQFDRLHPSVADQPSELGSPQHGHPRALEPHQHGDAIPRQVRSMASQAPGRAPGAGARARRCFHHRNRGHAAVQQFAGQLQVQRPVAGDQHALTRHHTLRPHQGLQRAGGDHSRQGPAGQRHRALVGTGCQHHAARPEGDRAAAHQRRNLVRREAAPHRRLGLDPHPGPSGPRPQRAAQAELPVGVGVRVTVGERLGVLAAGRGPLIQQNDRGTGLRGGDGGAEPGRPAADHQHVAGALRDAVLRHLAQWRQEIRRGAGHLHAVRRLGQAGALADAAVHRHHAVEAGAHAAMQPATSPGRGLAERDNASGRQGGGDRLALQRLDRLAVEAEADRPSGGMNAAVAEAHERAVSVGVAVHMLPAPAASDQSGHRVCG